MTQALFRREVVEARRNGWLGAISLAQPLRLWVLAVAAALAAAAVVAFLLLGSYARRSTVVGQLVPARGLSTVMAPAAGVVARLDVAEGAHVRAGQRLAVVAVPRAIPGEGDTLAALEARLGRRAEGLRQGHVARQRQLQAQEAGLRAQLAAARRELAQIEDEIRTRQAQVRLAHDTLDRLRQLEGGRYVSQLQIRQQESAALALVAETQALQRQATAARGAMARLAHALAGLEAEGQAAEAGFVGEMAVLEQERVETRARGELVLTAPVDGVVSAQLARPGQAVQAGQPLLSLLPDDSPLQAELLVPSRAIGFIAPGDRVLLRYQAYPYQKFGHHEGRVAGISRSALGSAELQALLGGIHQGEPFYRVTVSLARQDVLAYGRPEPLRPGMLLEADILGERRRLVEWLFEPLYSLRGRSADG